MKPLIKWPGGKSRELDRLLPHVPRTFSEYYEPFFGGGAVFFALSPNGPAHLNDANPSLMAFYDAVKRHDPAFVRRLHQLAETWDALGVLSQKLWGSLGPELVRPRALDSERVLSALSQVANETLANDMDPRFWNRLPAAITGKINRVRRLEEKHAVRFRPKRMADHLETAVRGAYYTHLRDDGPETDGRAAAADFFFIREFCYGSMFRFGPSGKLNIPYGGIAYNRKRFRKKIRHVLSRAVRRHLGRCTLSCTDFETFLDERCRSMSADDFVFLDPPYDTDFSEYDRLAFRTEDHERLARAIRRLPCRWLLVIKETDAVKRIYEPLADGGDRVKSTRFDKTYTYNVRGRNDRNVVHMVIANLEARAAAAR